MNITKREQLIFELAYCRGISNGIEFNVQNKKFELFTGGRNKNNHEKYCLARLNKEADKFNRSELKELCLNFVIKCR